MVDSIPQRVSRFNFNSNIQKMQNPRGEKKQTTSQRIDWEVVLHSLYIIHKVEKDVNNSILPAPKNSNFIHQLYKMGSSLISKKSTCTFASPPFSLESFHLFFFFG